MASSDLFQMGLSQDPEDGDGPEQSSGSLKLPLGLEHRA